MKTILSVIFTLTISRADVITTVDNVLAGESAFLECEASEVLGPVTSIFWTRKRASDTGATWVANYKLDENDGYVQINNDEISNAYVTSEITNLTSSSTLTLLNVQARETDQYDFVCGVGYEDESRGFIQNSQVANSVRVNVHEQPSAPYFSIKSKRGNAGEYECRIDEMGYPTAPELSLTLVKGDNSRRMLATGVTTVQSQIQLDKSLNGAKVVCSVAHAANDLPGAVKIPDDVDYFIAPAALRGEKRAVVYDHNVEGIGIPVDAFVADDTGMRPRSANEITMEKQFTLPRVNNVTNVCEVTVIASVPSSINPSPDLKWYAKGQLQKTGGSTYIHSARNSDNNYEVTLEINSALGDAQYLTTNVKNECFPPQPVASGVPTKAHGTLSLFLIIIIVIIVIVLVVIICVMARKRRDQKEEDEESGAKNQGELLSSTSPSDQTFNYQQD